MSIPSYNPSAPGAQVEKWQHRLDADFPHGLLASWEEKDGHTHGLHHVPRAEVVRMEGLDPVVVLPYGETAVFLRVLNYEVVQVLPCLVAVAVTGSKEPSTGAAGRRMLWSAGLSDQEVRQMASYREDLLQQFAKRGRSSFAE